MCGQSLIPLKFKHIHTHILVQIVSYKFHIISKFIGFLNSCNTRIMLRFTLLCEISAQTILVNSSCNHSQMSCPKRLPSNDKNGRAFYSKTFYCVLEELRNFVFVISLDILSNIWDHKKPSLTKIC